MIAIHNSKSGFHPAWIAYCQEQGIPFKLVNCLDDDIIGQLKDVRALLWHHSHMLPKDLIAAKPILAALSHQGFPVFPDCRTNWHFDDKLAQKYLLESLELPMVKTFAFYDPKDALSWARQTKYPTVHKLKTGSGSSQVRLVGNYHGAKKIILKSFGKGFSNYAPFNSLKERIYQFKNGHAPWMSIVKGLLRFVHYPEYATVQGRERGYVLFQEFVPNNPSDIRVIVIGNKAFAITRWVRKDDFRASGSGHFSHDPDLIPLSCLESAFKANQKLKGQCIAFDFVMDEKQTPRIIEISYGFSPEAFRHCPGHWDQHLHWQEGRFVPEHWMVEALLKDLVVTGASDPK
ncbi:RimK family alpha-L-glutamate ligase [Rhodonellum sp.]|uniref:ATP-grasp domain-containing protein n=1 Tax=Rhodonellum sp. TaxID=2231180 RepID=UPI0027158193|nr:hypothetical protein [Rhodonellum sp.]MDO9554919.1 hypothetical protein [Rhodonellum sp.]